MYVILALLQTRQIALFDAIDMLRMHDSPEGNEQLFKDDNKDK